MKAASSEPLELMEHLALVTARQQQDQYLQQLGALLDSLADAPPSSGYLPVPPHPACAMRR
jgi:hypothetical protein